MDQTPSRHVRSGTMPSDGNQLPVIYKEAIRRYEETTNKKLDDPSMLSINTVDELLVEIDRCNDRFSKFRETRHKLFSILEGVLKPVEIVSNLSSGATSMAFPPSTLVFGAAAYLLNAAKGVSASYDAIQSLMETLKVSCCMANFEAVGDLQLVLQNELYSTNKWCRALRCGLVCITKNRSRTN